VRRRYEDGCMEMGTWRWHATRRLEALYPLLALYNEQKTCIAPRLATKTASTLRGLHSQ